MPKPPLKVEVALTPAPLTASQSEAWRAYWRKILSGNPPASGGATP